MKEFCLIPKTMAERFLTQDLGGENNHNTDNNSNSKPRTKSQRNKKKTLAHSSSQTNKKKGSLTNTSRGKKASQTQQHQSKQAMPTSTDISFPPRATRPPVAGNDPRPSLNHLIDVKISKESQKDYIKSMLYMMSRSPGVSWDTSGNLLEPIRNFNIINILKTLGDGSDRTGFPKNDIPLIRMLLHSVDPSFIRSNKVKKQLLLGGSKFSFSPPSSFAQAQRKSWEKYSI